MAPPLFVLMRPLGSMHQTFCIVCLQGAPECLSFVFNKDGKCTSYTGGARRIRRTSCCMPPYFWPWNKRDGTYAIPRQHDRQHLPQHRHVRPSIGPIRKDLTPIFAPGYIMDRRVGNTQKMGALFGILAAIGAPVPQPGSFRFMLPSAVNGLRQRLAALFGRS